MQFWALVLLLFSIGLFAVAIVLVLAVADRGKDPTRRQLAVGAAVCVGAALLLLRAATGGGIGADHAGLAKDIADQIRSVPLKVELAGVRPGPALVQDPSNLPNDRLLGGGATGGDARALAKAITDGLRAAPLDVVVTKALPFDNAALARAIVDQLPPPSATGPALDARAAEGTGLLVLILSTLGTIAALLRTLVFKKSSWKETMIGLSGIAVGLVAIITAHYWPPPTDSNHIEVSFDGAGFSVGQNFFEASAKTPIRFSSADDVPPEEAVCAALQELNARGSTVAIVVGTHDQQPLSSAATLRFGSNASLARQRAESVKALLAGENHTHACATPPIKTVITLSNPPAISNNRNQKRELLEKDRAVTVFGLGGR